MAEPQPANATEVEEQPAPAAAEDRKAAAALSALNSADAGDARASAADQKALGEAMSRLEVLDPNSKSAAAGDTKSSASTGKPQEAKKIKLRPEDVQLLVDELEVGKVRAQEMLRECDADLGRALEEWIQKGAQVV